MKIRSGFVSNSSSSSFVIQWQCNMLEEEEGLDRALSVLFDFCDDELIAQIKEKTVEMNDRNDRFETRFYTCMRNSIMDYGNAAMLLLSALEIENAENGIRRFEKLHIHVNADDFE